VTRLTPMEECELLGEIALGLVVDPPSTYHAKYHR
jgi:hypothetical protein